VEPFEVRIGDSKALIEIDDPDSGNWKGMVIEGAALDVGEVIVHLLEKSQERVSRARVVVTGPYLPTELDGLEAFH
jgi:hypothetical protein